MVVTVEDGGNTITSDERWDDPAASVEVIAPSDEYKPQLGQQWVVGETNQQQQQEQRRNRRQDRRERHRNKATTTRSPHRRSETFGGSSSKCVGGGGDGSAVDSDAAVASAYPVEIAEFDVESHVNGFNNKISNKNRNIINIDVNDDAPSTSALPGDDQQQRRTNRRRPTSSTKGASYTHSKILACLIGIGILLGVIYGLIVLVDFMRTNDIKFRDTAKTTTTNNNDDSNESNKFKILEDDDTMISTSHQQLTVPVDDIPCDDSDLSC